MDILDYARTAYKSANRYLKFVQKNNHAKNIVNVTSIEQLGDSKFILHTSARTPYTESAEIVLIQEGVKLAYEPDEIKITDFSEKKGYLTVFALSQKCRDAFKNASPSDITLVSDLSFLIKNVRDWYKDFHNRIAYPCLPLVAVDEGLFPAYMSEGQKKAAHQALENAVSYIWGAPGTGKTQMVLSNAILQYININETVLLVAPTNNAIEQSLRGLIKVLESHGKAIKCIVRFGRATSEFVTQYPQICEAGYYDSLIEDSKKEIAELKELFKRQCEHDQIMSLYASFKKLSQEISTLSTQYDDAKKAVRDIEQKRNTITTDCEKNKRQAIRLQNKLGAMYDRLAKQNHFDLITSSFDEFSNLISQYNSELDHIASRLSQAEQAYYAAAQNEKTTRRAADLAADALYYTRKEQKKFSVKLKCIFSRETRRDYENKIKNLSAKAAVAKESHDSALTICKCWQSTITDLQVRSKNTQEARDNHPYMHAISLKTFNKALPYDKLSVAFKKELSSFNGFVPDEQLKIKISENEKQLADLHLQHNELEETIANLDAAISDASNLIQATSNDIEAQRNNAHRLSTTAFGRDFSFDELKKRFDEEISHWNGFKPISNLKNIIAQKESDLNFILTQVKKITESKLVIACTIDYLISHFEAVSSLSISHIFVDEAAYCPLIKSAAVFALGKPVTLLGDHLQLPPICEMDSRAIIGQKDNNNVFLWDISAIYFPSIFCKEVTLESLFEDYANGHMQSPQRYTATSFLTHTFRFGDKLASILDKFVYKQGFEGEKEADFNITVINVPHLQSKLKSRVNASEANAIKKYVAKYHPQDYAILVPYRDQRQYIQQLLKPVPGVLNTIHGAQGREWDTVIVSVTDATSSDKWLMTIKKPSNGMMIVNTAVSRARKHIILVLDYNYWQSCDDELISGIAALSNNVIELDSL